MSLTELLLQAKAKKSKELLFVVGNEPRIRTSKGWETLRNSPGLITEWKLLQQSFLDTKEMNLLEQQGFIHGEARFENIRVGFSFFQVNEVMKAVLDLDIDGAREEINLPQSVIETCLVMKGLVIFSGPGDAGQGLSIYKVLQKLASDKCFLGVVFSARAFPQVRESKSGFIYHTGRFSSPMERETFLTGVDMVVFNNPSDDDKLCEALALVERGIFVIYAMSAPSLPNALRRCFAVMTQKHGRQGAGRLSETFSLAVGQYAMTGLTGERVFAHEVLVAKPQVREWIESENIKALESMLTTSPENSGVLTLNQSLLQHLIRRRLNIKTAFECSRDPDGLDQLLKKVGI